MTDPHDRVAADDMPLWEPLFKTFGFLRARRAILTNPTVCLRSCPEVPFSPLNFVVRGTLVVVFLVMFVAIVLGPLTGDPLAIHNRVLRDLTFLQTIQGAALRQVDTDDALFDPQEARLLSQHLWTSDYFSGMYEYHLVEDDGDLTEVPPPLLKEVNYAEPQPLNDAASLKESIRVMKRVTAGERFQLRFFPLWSAPLLLASAVMFGWLLRRKMPQHPGVGQSVRLFCYYCTAAFFPLIALEAVATQSATLMQGLLYERILHGWEAEAEWQKHALYLGSLQQATLRYFPVLLLVLWQAVYIPRASIALAQVMGVQRQLQFPADDNYNSRVLCRVWARDRAVLP